MDYALQSVPVSRIDVWDEAQARRLDSRGVESLAKSIRADGLQNPPLVQRDGDRYTLISGQRRLAAVRSLGRTSIPVLVLQSRRASVEDAKASSLVENMHRLGMSPAETSKATRFIVRQKGKREACRILGMSARTLERHLGFDALPDSLKELVPESLSRDHAIRLFRSAKNAADALEIAGLVSRYDESKKDRYLKALADNPDDAHADLLRKSNRYYAGTFRLGLPPASMKKLAAESERQDVTSEQLVSMIVKEWLAGR